MELLSAVVFLNLSESDSWFEAAHFPCYPTASSPLWSRLSLSSLCFGHNRRQYPADILSEELAAKDNSFKLLCAFMGKPFAHFEGWKAVSSGSVYQNMSGWTMRTAVAPSGSKDIDNGANEKALWPFFYTLQNEQNTIWLAWAGIRTSCKACF